NRFAAVRANHPVSRSVVIAAPGKLRLHRYGQISPILVIEILSAASIGRIVGVPIVRRVIAIVRRVIPIVRGVRRVRGVPGIPPREAKRNEIKTEKETVLMMKEEPIVVNETVVKKPIMVNETVVKKPIMVNETVVNETVVNETMVNETIVGTKSKPT